MKKHIAQFLVLAVALILLGCAHATPGTPTEQEPVAAVTEATTETTAPRETKAPTEPAETAAPREPEETEAPTEAPTEHKHSFRKKVTKEPMFTLPKTGNSGTWMYGVAGIALMAIGCTPLLLAIRRKRYRG